jgi:N-methylhydantoinase A
MAQSVIAVDVGGTFTDVALAELASGRLWTAKTPTTPQDPSVGFAAGVGALLRQAGVPVGDVAAILHGSTVATNMIIERKGSPVVLLTTAGCRFVLHIGRHDVPKSEHMYLWVKPPRLVTPEHIHEVPERLDHTGAVLEALDEEACAGLLDRLRAQGAEAIAICLLHAYANPVHEARLKALCQARCPDTPLSVSSEVLPQFREYERTMATVLNAYVLPRTGGYYRRLGRRVGDLGVAAPVLIMKSNGGMASAAAAAERPVLTVLSGPAAAVVGAIAVTRQAGFERCISIDVGGTSADVCLAREARPTLTTDGEIADLPLPFPMVDVRSIGAGGGSIARVVDGSLEVGPDSAGADPGPACYGRGGAEPTVTDAHLVLGRLDTALLGGALSLDRDRAAAAIRAKVAEPLGLSLEAAAHGILEILNNTMVGAIRAISIERGHDPRDFALVACGGAGPLHGGRLAELLGIPAVIVPRYSGVLSTLGLLGSDIKNDYVRTMRAREGAWDAAAVDRAVAELAAEGRRWLRDEGVPPAAQRIERFADLRYANQGYELTVPLPDGPVTRAALDRAVEAFHAEHERLYTYATRDLPVEIVNLRVSAQGPAWAFAPGPIEATGAPAPPPRVRPAYFPAAGGFVDCPVHDAAALPVGASVTGPAVITQDLSTIVVEPGHRARVDRFGNVLIELPPAHA